MRNEFMTVYTGLCGKTAAKTLKLFLQRMNENRDYRSIERHVYNNTNISVATDGNICINIDSYVFRNNAQNYYKDRFTNSPFLSGFDATVIKSWFATRLKEIVRDRDMNDVIQLHPKSRTSPTSKVWEVAATADALMGIDIKSKYGSKICEKVLGCSIDPVRVEVNAVINEEIQRIHTEFKQRQRNAKLDLNKKIQELRNQYRAMVAALGKEERRAVSNMKKEMLTTMTA